MARAVFLLALSLPVLQSLSFAAEEGKEETVRTDLLIVGGTESGWAAAIQAARQGVESIAIVHDGTWLGGQYTEQSLVCVDENKGVGKEGWGVDWHPMKRSFYRSGLFKELMDGIEAVNTEKYGSPMPGKPFHGPSTFRPAEAEAVFRKLLQPYIDSGQVRVFWNRYPLSAEVEDPKSDHPKLTGLHFAPVEQMNPKTAKADLHVTARMTIDASDWGEAIQVSGAAYECGPDPKTRYGEPSAPADLSENPPNEMNPITWAMVVAESDGDTPIPEPANYDVRNYVRVSKLSTRLAKGLTWDRETKVGSILHWPPDGEASARQLSVFSVRRIVDGYSSKDGKTSILLNYMNGQDYPLERLPLRVVEALEATEPGASEKNIVEMTREQRQIVYEDAKRHALGVFHHLQTFVHEHADQKENSFRHFHLSTEFGTPDNLPPKPYIREALRLKALYMMREQDGRNRDAETKTGARERFSYVMYPDGLFAWQFHYDFHRTGRTYLTDEGAAGPWIDYEKPGRHTRYVSDRSVFPLRSLIPEKMEGLLGAQKNVGYSSIVSAAIRLHDQCVHIGQAAGATAAVCLKEDIAPWEIVYGEEPLLEKVRDGLCQEGGEGVPLQIWPFRDLDPAHPAFVAVNRLAARGLLPLGEREVDFRPDEKADPAWVAKVAEKALGSVNPESVKPLAPEAETTRGEVAMKVWSARKALDQAERPQSAPHRSSEFDADGDSIPDRMDAFLFTANQPIVWRVDPPPAAGPAEDGLLDSDASASGRRFNFSQQSGKDSGLFETDSGQPFDPLRGHGWRRDLSRDSFRKRGAVPEDYRDSFVFTRRQDTWECQVADGAYRVTVCVGDSSHEQANQNVTVEGMPLVQNVSTQAGRFREASSEVTVKDGKLTVTIGRPEGEANTCLNWLFFERVEP